MIHGFTTIWSYGNLKRRYKYKKKITLEKLWEAACSGDIIERKLHKMKKIIKKVLDWIIFIMTGKGDLANEMIEAGVLDYSGQGRDKYGR